MDKMISETPIFCIVGESNTGKTSLVCDLIEGLDERGYEVGSIKHTRGDFSIDSEGKDTWHHAEAGSKLVGFSAKNETDFIFKERLEVESLVSKMERLGNFDVILIEGMKGEEFPKIATEGYQGEDVSIRYEDNFEEIIDHIEEIINIEHILDQLPETDCKKCGYDSCEGLAKSIYREKSSLDDCGFKRGKVRLKINGDEVELSRFPSKFMEKTVRGMVNSLKGVDEKENKNIEIKIKEDR